MEEAVSFKDRANALFAKKEYKEALKLYDSALAAVIKVREPVCVEDDLP